MLTRWSKGYRAASAQNVFELFTAFVPLAHEAKSIAVQQLINKQQKHQHPVGIEKKDDGVYKKGQQTWILDEAYNFKVRIKVDAHCRERGHRA